MIQKVNIYSINNPTYRLYFTHEIYILNNYITIGYLFSSQYCYYAVSSFPDYCYVNILLIASKDNKKLANPRILSRYLTEKCKIQGLGRCFTPLLRVKNAPPRTLNHALKVGNFDKNRRNDRQKTGKRRTIRHEYEPDECRLFYTYTIIARLHTNHIQH